MARLRTATSRLAPSSSLLRRPPKSEAVRLAQRDRQRPNWYQSKRWRDLRLVILRRDRWRCLQTGVLLVGKYPGPDSPVIDHIVPHRWDEALFWDETNLQSVSKEWHDGEKQRQDRLG